LHFIGLLNIFNLPHCTKEVERFLWTFAITHLTAVAHLALQKGSVMEEQLLISVFKIKNETSFSTGLVS